MNKTFHYQTVTTKQIKDYISTEAKIDFSKVFDQYLRTVKIPKLVYKLKKGTLTYKWTNCVKGFNMPIKVMLEKDVYIFIYPTETEQKIKTKLKKEEEFKVDANFYVLIERMK